MADAINLQAEANLVEAVKLIGKRFDCGSVNGAVEAIKYEYSKRCLELENP